MKSISKQRKRVLPFHPGPPQDAPEQAQESKARQGEGAAAIPGSTRPFLLLTNVQLPDAGNYTLFASNATGLTNSQMITLTVEPEPAVTEVLLPQNVLIGTSVCLPATVSGAEPLVFQWQLNGRDLLEGGRVTGVNSRVLCLSSAAGGDNGSYTLVVSNSYGCVTGLVARLSVSPILAWGDNSAGQLDAPIGTTDIVALSAGGDHNLALRADGTVVAWGDNSSGQCDVPPSLNNVVALAAGDSHSLALRADGSVIAWGENSYGQINIPSSATNVVAIAADAWYSLALRLDGTTVMWASTLSSGAYVPLWATNIIAIAAGGGGPLGLRSDDALVSLWYSAPPLATNIDSVAVGGNGALTLRDDGSLIAWGGNYFGQASVPASATNVVAVAAGGDHNMALLGDGTVAVWGANYFGQALVPPQATNVSAISAGGAHSLALVGTPTAPLHVQARVGTSVLLTAGPLGRAGPGLQWQFNGADLPGETNAFLWLGFVTLTNAGTYRVSVGNLHGSVIGPPIVLTVLGMPLVFDTSAGGLLATNGGLNLRLLGASGAGPVVIYASSDLLTWQPIFTNAAVIGRLEFTDPGITNRPVRFYRASENPSP